MRNCEIYMYLSCCLCVSVVAALICVMLRFCVLSVTELVSVGRNFDLIKT